MQKIENMDVEELSLTQLKSETVRLEKEAKRIEIRRKAVNERLDRMLSMYMARKKHSMAPSEEPQPEPEPVRQAETQEQEPLEHKQLPPQKRKKSQCWVEGCTNNINAGGLCTQHLHPEQEQQPMMMEHSVHKRNLNPHKQQPIKAKKSKQREHTKRCSVAGCAKFAQRQGVCYQHGAEVPRCSIEGCTNRMQRKGLCIKHGARDDVQKCSLGGCRNVAREGGLCKKHKNEMEDNDLMMMMNEGEMIMEGASEEDAASSSMNMGVNPFVPEA